MAKQTRLTGWGIIVLVLGICLQDAGPGLSQATLGQPTAQPIVGGEKKNPTVASYLLHLVAQPPGRPGAAVSTDEEEPTLLDLEVPGYLRLFQLDSEESFRERVRMEARQKYLTKKIEFPDLPKPLKGPAHAPRRWPQLIEEVEPAYVCHRRLYFEQINAERYGWDLGVFHPFVSAGLFYWDLGNLPLYWVMPPWTRFECSAGHCLPGDPLPLVLYPPWRK